MRSVTSGGHTTPAVSKPCTSWSCRRCFRGQTTQISGSSSPKWRTRWPSGGTHLDFAVWIAVPAAKDGSSSSVKGSEERRLQTSCGRTSSFRGTNRGWGERSAGGDRTWPRCPEHRRVARRRRINSPGRKPGNHGHRRLAVLARRAPLAASREPRQNGRNQLGRRPRSLLAWGGTRFDDLPRPVFLAVGSLSERKNVLRLAERISNASGGAPWSSSVAVRFIVISNDAPACGCWARRSRRCARASCAARTSSVPHRCSSRSDRGSWRRWRWAGRSLQQGLEGPPEFVTREAGLLVDPLDATQLAEALESALDFPTPNLAARDAAATNDVKLQASG